MKNVYEKVKDLSIEKRAFINGKYVEGKNKKTISKKNSYNGFDLSGIVACDEDDINIAVQIAKESFYTGKWRNCPLLKKRKLC